MKRILIAILLFVSVAINAQIIRIENRDTISVTGSIIPIWPGVYYQPETLSDYVDTMQYWSGSLNFDSKLWVDKSGTGQDLRMVQSNCLAVDSSHFITNSGIPDNLKFANDESFTIKLSFYRHEYKASAWQGLFSIGLITDGITLGVYGQDVRFYFQGGTDFVATPNLLDSTVYEIYAVRDPYNSIDGTNSQFIYYNGNVSAADNSNASPSYGNDNFRIGNLVSYNLSFDGLIWDVAVYDTVVTPTTSESFVPLYWWPMSEGGGNYTHDVINDTLYAITNDGNWSKQDSFHYNWEYGASYITYSTDSVWIPFTNLSDTIYDANYISNNGNYLNASETVVQCIASNDYPPIETKLIPADTMYDHNNFWYDGSNIAIPRWYDDFTANWDQQNYVMCDTTSTNKSNIVVWRNSMDDDFYQQVRDLFGIPLVWNTINVESDGSGDFTTLTAALASISDNSIYNRYNIRFHEEFEEEGLDMKHFVNLVGTDSASAKITGYLPEDTPIGTIQFAATIDGDFINFNVSNATVTCQNMRYPVHIDAGANDGTNRPITQKFTNCQFIHYANDEADAYHEETVWATMDAFGVGLSSNVRMKFRGCTGLTYGTTVPSRGIGIHGASSAVSYKSIVEMTNCTFTGNTGNNRAVRVGNLFNNQDEYYFSNVIMYDDLYIDGSGTYTDNTTITGTSPKTLNGSIISD